MKDDSPLDADYLLVGPWRPALFAKSEELPNVSAGHQPELINHLKTNECKEKPKFEGNCHKCKKNGHKASQFKSKSLNPAKQFIKAIFGWDYNA